MRTDPGAKVEEDHVDQFAQIWLIADRLTQSAGLRDGALDPCLRVVSVLGHRCDKAQEGRAGRVTPRADPVVPARGGDRRRQGRIRMQRALSAP